MIEDKRCQKMLNFIVKSEFFMAAHKYRIVLVLKKANCVIINKYQRWC